MLTCIQSDECPWCRIFVALPSREFHLHIIVVFVFRSHCLLLRSLTCLSPFLLYWCCWFTCDKFVVFLCVAFVYSFNVKRWYTVAIFVMWPICKYCNVENKSLRHIPGICESLIYPSSISNGGQGVITAYFTANGNLKFV